MDPLATVNYRSILSSLKCLFVCTNVFLSHQESSNVISRDNPHVSEVVMQHLALEQNQV
jgi:hypothetical protein